LKAFWSLTLVGCALFWAFVISLLTGCATVGQLQQVEAEAKKMQMESANAWAILNERKDDAERRLKLLENQVEGLTRGYEVKPGLLPDRGTVILKSDEDGVIHYPNGIVNTPYYHLDNRLPKIGEDFDRLADDVACEVDEKFIEDDSTPGWLRKVLAESVKKCRTKRQQKALERMAERMPGPSKLPKPSLLEKSK
jgi:uncharacterized protein (UPF0147 family)